MNSAAELAKQQIAALKKERIERLNAAALPGESLAETEIRLQATARQQEQKKTQAISAHAKKNKAAHASQTAASTAHAATQRKSSIVDNSNHEFSARENRCMMDVALFSLSKTKSKELRRYELQNGYVEVAAGSYGMATIWDYDIVLLLTSYLTHQYNEHKAGKSGLPSRKVVISPAYINKFCKRGVGGNQVDSLIPALDRLKSTTVKCVRKIKRRSQKELLEIQSESLISSYRVVAINKTGKITKLEIEAPQWLYDEVIQRKSLDVLTVHADYFSISTGLGKFIYRLARVAAGKSSAEWAFDTIYKRCGSQTTKKEFNRLLRKVIQQNNLPEYELTEIKNGKGSPHLVINKKEKVGNIQTV